MGSVLAQMPLAGWVQRTADARSKHAALVLFEIFISEVIWLKTGSHKAIKLTETACI